jgi:MarR-like DNA-binding transcriptional regulator SgrR of sgrS sRNA
MAAVCDKLIELDAKLTYVPQRATEWAWAADGLALTLKLRAAVLFHDGEPLDTGACRSASPTGSSRPPQTAGSRPLLLDETLRSRSSTQPY